MRNIYESNNGFENMSKFIAKRNLTVVRITVVAQKIFGFLPQIVLGDEHPQVKILFGQVMNVELKGIRKWNSNMRHRKLSYHYSVK